MCDKNETYKREALSFMGYGDSMPISMKELVQMYHKLAIQMHPDKNGGSKEATEMTQKLISYYLFLGNLIKSKVDTTSKEEAEGVNIFEQFETFNSDIKRMNSHTILIENSKTSQWKLVLKENFGEPKDNGDSGFIYKFMYAKEDESRELTVTLYDNPSDGSSKLRIQSGSQFLNDLFTSQELPRCYARVRSLQMPAGLDAGGPGGDVHGEGDAGADKGGRKPRARQPTRSAKHSSETQKRI